jgi:hypothetical protein
LPARCCPAFLAAPAANDLLGHNAVAAKSRSDIRQRHKADMAKLEHIDATPEIDGG